jgi:hypothetical protein
MQSLDLRGINELLQPDFDPSGQLADYRAGVACDIAVALGNRFYQASNGQYGAETVAPSVAVRPLGTLHSAFPAQVEIDERFTSIPFNPAVVSFIAFKDRDGQRQPAVPVLERYKIEAMARTKYGHHTSNKAASSAGFSMRGLVARYSQPMEHEYVRGGMIRADKLHELVPRMQDGIRVEREDHEAFVAGARARGDNHRESYIRSLETRVQEREVIVDVLSMCLDRLLLEA